MVDILFSSKVSKEVITHHVELVWVDTAFGVLPPAYFDFFDTLPTDTNKLNVLQNNCKMKHFMMGKTIWLRLTSVFKIEIVSNMTGFEGGNTMDSFFGNQSTAERI